MQALFHAESFAAEVDEFRGDLEAARARYANAIAVAETIENNAELLALGYSHLGMVLLKIGDLDLAIDFIHRGLELSEQRGDMVGPLYDRINLSYALTVQGRYDEAKQLAIQGLALAERMRQAYLVAGLAAAAGDASFRKGDLDTAEECAVRSLLQEEEFFRPWALTVLGLVQGDSQHTKAVQTLSSAADMARAIDDDYGEAYALCALGEVHASCNEHGEAESAFRRALRTYRRLGFQLEALRAATRMDQLGMPVPEPEG